MFEIIFENWFYSLFLPMLFWSIIPIIKGRYFWVLIVLLSNIFAFIALLDGVRLQGIGGLPLLVLSFRLARPNSVWFTKFYKEDKKELSRKRFTDNDFQNDENLPSVKINDVQKQIDILDQNKIEKHQIDELNHKRKEAGLISYEEYLQLEENISKLTQQYDKKIQNKQIISEGRKKETEKSTYLYVLIFVVSFFQSSLLVGTSIFISLSFINFIYWRNRFKRTDSVLRSTEKRCEKIAYELEELTRYKDENSVKKTTDL